VREFLRRRVVRPVVDQLTQGLSPDAISLTIAVGLAIAVVPVVGTTTILCTTAAIVLRLNQPLIQGINYLSFPLQLAFIVPYLRLGRLLFGGEPVDLSAQELAAFVTSRPMEAAEALWRVTLQALGAWLLTAPFIAAAVFFAVRPFLRIAARRLRPAGPQKPAPAVEGDRAPGDAAGAGPLLAVLPAPVAEEPDGR
jgi:uncharacterized protein (DUF2062 family)